MNRTLSLSNFTNSIQSESIEVPVADLYQIRQSLESVMKVIDKHLSQFSAQKIGEVGTKAKEEFEPKESDSNSAEPVKETKKAAQPKAKALGVCMFVNKRILKEQSIGTREELEGCNQRCSNKAIHLKNGILLCSRHKDSDIGKMEEIVNGIKPQINTLEVELDKEGQPTIETAVKEVKEGQYGSQRHPSNLSDVEDAINECTHLERLLEETDNIVPCRIGLKEVCLAVFNEVRYVVDPLGDCYGKITSEEKLSAFELKMKTKEYFDVRGSIEPLEDEKDVEFLTHHSLNYTKEYCNKISA